jgi:hypothetical protein
MGMNVAEFIFWTLLDNRYHNMQKISQQGQYCENEALNTHVFLEGEDLLRAQVRTVIRIFGDVRRCVGVD